MKIIHCADLHLDSKMETSLSKEQAAQRRQELFSTFLKLISYAQEEGVSAILIAGDMFDTSEHVQVRMKRRVLEAIGQANEIDFLYLRGNHDKGDFFTSLNPQELPGNLKLFREGWQHYRYGDIVISGCELGEGSEAEVYGSLELNVDDFNIVMLHGQESRYRISDASEVVRLDLLQEKHIDYLALGHIHSYYCGKLDDRGLYCYPGCMEGRGFDECGEKGFLLLEVTKQGFTHCFVPISGRKFHTVSVSLDGFMTERELREAIEENVKEISPSDIVKIIFTGEITEETDIDTEHMLHLYKDRFYFLKILDQTKLQIRYEDFAKDISLKGEFIRLVESQELDENEKLDIILTGLKALAGREIDI